MLQVNEIYTGDCLEVLPQIDDNTVDLVVTSPPYNIGIDYGVYKDNMEWSRYYSWCSQWIRELYRVLKLSGRLCLNHYLSLGQSDNRSSPLMRLDTICQEAGFRHHGIAIWEDTTLTKRTAWGSWLSASAPYVNCLDSKTPVFTDTGLIELKDISAGARVFTSKARYCRVLGCGTKVVDRAVSLRLWHNTYLPIRCSFEHKFYVIRRDTYWGAGQWNRCYRFSQPQWVSAGEIVKTFKKNRGRKGEVVYFTGFPIEKGGNLPEWLYDTGLPVHTPDFWFLVGLFLADGCLMDMEYKRKRGWEIVWVIGNKKIERCASAIVNLGWQVSYKQYRNRVNISFYSKELFQFLCKFFSLEAFSICGSKAHCKIIPEWCITLPDRYAEQLLCGYVYGDGYSFRRANGKVGYGVVSTSAMLLLQLQRLMFRFGKFATFFQCRRAGEQFTFGKICKVKDRFSLVWYDIPTKDKPVRIIDGYYWFPIKSVSIVEGRFEMMDLAVEGDESYCLPCAVSHNSPFEGVAIYYKGAWKKPNKGVSTITAMEFMQACSGVWNIGTDRDRLTPATFPVKLAKLCINLLSYQDDLVLDPFSGSGTTALACKRLRRRYIGIELNPEFAEISRQRLKREKVTELLW